MYNDTRRRWLKFGLVFPFAAWLTSTADAQSPVSAATLKSGYAARLKRILADGKLPYVDIESSCNPSKVDIAFVAGSMDALNIGLMALSADPTKGQFAKGVRFDNLSERLLAAFPDRFIPVGNGGQPPFITETPDAFLAAQEAAAAKGPMFLLGEYEMRHYPSPRQAKRGSLDRDVDIPIDGPVGHRVFALSEKLGLPFQLHYEIEDRLLPPLERMLDQYPRARVIWCHVGQVRYIERASRYSPAYLEGLIKRFPNLWFDTAFADAMSVYPMSNQRHARVWGTFGALRDDWLDILVAYPERFLSALDLGGDRIEQIADHDRKHRDFLRRLPQETQHRIAYRTAWSLLFGEEFA